MILIKVLISIIAISFLIFISERKPKIGGLLSGLPIGTGIITFFNAIEQGSKFVVDGLPYAILGLLSSLFFTIGFYIGGKFFMRISYVNTLIAFTFGISFFLIIGYSITFFQANILVSSMLFLIGVVGSAFFFKSIKENNGTTNRNRSYSSIVFRVIFVAILIVIITGIAKFAGPKWAGILASFPTVLAPVLMVLCYFHQDRIYPTVIKNFTFGITTLLIFYITISYTFINFEIYIGIFISYLSCFVYLFLLSATINMMKNHFLKQQT